MVRVLATALVVVWVGTADAAPKRKVKIVTEPKGAVVYIESPENGPACPETPCTIEVEAGVETPIVIDLKDHQRLYENVVAPKKGKVAEFTYKLKAALGTLTFEEPDGASITVDDEDKGKVPTSVEVSAESHHVVVIHKGKTVVDAYLDVTAGSDLIVEPKAVAGSGGGGTSPEGGGEGGGGEGGEGGGEGGEGGGSSTGGGIEKGVKPKQPRDRFVSLAAVLDVGFREFTYGGANVTKQTLRNESEAGQVLAGPLVELWPGSMAGIRFLRGLSILGRYQYGLNKQAVNAMGLSGPTNTFWQSMELSLRHRWTFAQTVTLELGGGYVRDQFQFEGASTDVDMVPDVDYKSFRLGGRASLLIGPIEPYLTFENRVVQSGGKLATRFRTAKPAGFRASVGLLLRRGKLVARVEGSATQYTWKFDFDPASDMRATSATDAVRQVGFVVGYEY